MGEEGLGGEGNGFAEYLLRMSQRSRPKALLVRFRHPHARPMRAVSVNGRAWSDFNTAQEWVRTERPMEARYSIVAEY